MTPSSAESIVCNCRLSSRPHVHNDEHGIIDVDLSPSDRLQAWKELCERATPAGLMAALEEALIWVPEHDAGLENYPGGINHCTRCAIEKALEGL
jgi:hypothetical protein